MCELARWKGYAFAYHLQVSAFAVIESQRIQGLAQNRVAGFQKAKKSGIPDTVLCGPATAPAWRTHSSVRDPGRENHTCPGLRTPAPQVLVLLDSLVTLVGRLLISAARWSGIRAHFRYDRQPGGPLS